MKRIVGSLVFVSLLISACGPSPDQIQTAIAQTQVAIPTATVEPTATPKPMTAADLEPLLFQSGDLPGEYLLGQFKMDPPKEWPTPELFRGVSFEYEGYKGYLGAWVNIGVYSEPVVGETFEEMADFVGDPVDELGNLAMVKDRQMDLYAGVYGWLVYDVSVAWTKCNYVVTILSQTPARSGTIIPYARRLDERLVEALCP